MQVVAVMAEPDAVGLVAVVGGYPVEPADQVRVVADGLRPLLRGQVLPPLVEVLGRAAPLVKQVLLGDRRQRQSPEAGAWLREVDVDGVGGAVIERPCPL